MTLRLKGTTLVHADRQVVWSALHDTALVSRCVPGCRSLVQCSRDCYELIASLRFGPISWEFRGTIVVASSQAPRRYELHGQGRGRWGTASGRAVITLEPCRGGCTVGYLIDADLTGLLAAARVLSSDRVGRTLAALFAARFGQLLDAGQSQLNVRHA